MNDKINEICYEEYSSSPPRFFQHVELFKTFEGAKTIDQFKLTNMINHLHFTGSPLFILLKHPVYQNSLLVKAHPEPCIGNRLTCRWDESYFQYKLESHHPLCLLIIDDPFIIITPFNLLRSDNNSFTIHLPDSCYALNQRQSQRYHCVNISAKLVQSDFMVSGELIDFSPTAIRIRADMETRQFNPDVPMSIRLIVNETTIYSEFCRCIRWQNDQNISTEIVFASESRHISRFQSKKIRNPRLQINPPLTAVFDHPFINKIIHKDIFDLSSAGFSIRDKPDDAVFFPGMTIPNISIHLAGISIANCIAQIIYQRIEENDIHYGFAILDMDIHSYSRINHILSINSDPRIYISTKVELDALWRFFFQTGFIYPEKYAGCQIHRKNFIETYRRLYQESPEIARHITYEKNGNIYGHISMVRAYERTWLIQHHAAKSIEYKSAGLAVLRQMMIFLNGMYQLSSNKMDYVISYFRPENKFPNRVFGGFARDFNDPQACSLDLFTYLTLPITSTSKDLPCEWQLRNSNAHDYWELSQCYKYNSGGLLLKILRVGKSDGGNASLEKLYERLGFLRKCRSYSLSYQDNLKAVFVVDQSDLAINMSNLLNCIKVLIIDPSGLSQEQILIAITKLGIVYNLDKVTLLIYPSTGIDSYNFTYNKRYQLWILNLQFSNQFMEYVQKNFRMKYE